MFSGIIEELGTVRLLDKNGPIAKLQVLAPKLAIGTQPGQSICVNGACLTVVEVNKDWFEFDVMQETFKHSNLDLFREGDRVNLERALKVDGRVDGHFVTGHIDTTGVIKSRQKSGSDVVIEIEAPEEALRYIVLKGSVALDGVSLTVSALSARSFCVSLIPYTLTNTTLGLKKEKEAVNIECDILAKYVERLSAPSRQPPASNITMSFLQKHGFTP